MYYKNFAKVYDEFMSFCDYDEWVSLIERFIVESGVEGKKLLEIGCGTGEILKRLQNKYECTGLDLSENMLKIAQTKLKNKDIKLFLGDMREFNTGEKYDIIVALFDTINHLTSQEELLDTLNSVKSSLNENGIFIFDLVDREFMNEMFHGGVFYDNRENLVTIWEHFMEGELDIIEATYFSKNKNGTYDRYEEVYEKRIFFEHEVKKNIEFCNLYLLSSYKSDKIAGRRKFYVIQNRE